VSPRWRDELSIYLAPHRLALARGARGLHRRPGTATELPVPEGAGGELGPALARLAEVLSDPAWHGGAARVVVADQPWVRYGIAPWPEARLDAAGRLSHARYLIADAYGDAVADWTVTLADTPPGRPCVACATVPGLRAGLEDALAPAGISLISLQPRLVAAFNAWRRRLPADDAWFVSVGDGALSAVHLRRGAWERVHVARLSADWGIELERLQALGRVTQAAGAAGRMLVDAPARLRCGAPADAEIEWLEPGTGGAPPAHELALLQGVQA
jgi:hypothetical protein